MASRHDREFATRWPIVLTALVGLAFGLGTVPFYTIGIFAPALARDFGWSMSEILLGLSILSASIVVVGPIVGGLADKYGARKLTLFSLVLYGLGFVSLALNRGSLTLYYLSWAAISVCGVGTTAITYTRALNGWFTKQRGLALGIAFSGSGIFGMIGKPVIDILVTTYSWRVGFIVLGALPIVFAFPLAIAFLRDPPPAARNVPRAGQKLGEVARRWRFWLIALVYTLAAATTGGIIVSLETILTQKGFSNTALVYLTPVLGLAIIIGEVGTGMLLDRLPTAIVTGTQLLITFVCCIAFAQQHLSATAAVAGIAGVGLSGAAMYTVLSFLALRYFGITHYSAVFGTLTAFVTAGPAIGGLLLALCLDRLGTYLPVFWMAAGVAAASAVAIIAQDRAWLRSSAAGLAQMA